MAAIEAAHARADRAGLRRGQEDDAARRGDRGLQVARRGLQAAPGRGHARREGHGPVLPPGVRRHVPRPARAEHALPQGLQAHEAGRRLLARRRQERAAAAHLRHGLGRQEAARRLHPAASRRPRSATTASSARNWTCSTSTRWRRAWCSGIPRAGRSGSRSSSTCASVYRDTGYQEVKGPQILDKSLWEKTGHWQNYRENMFTTESEKRDYALKPMNCPGHVLIFKSDLRSYRDLPIRYGEFGQCHRNEPSGGAARHHARARLHAGRRPHLLHGRPDPRRVRGLHGAAAEGLCRFRLQRHPLQGRHAARQPHRLRRHSGTRPSTR